MPQVWLTDEELGAELGRDAHQARAIALRESWRRKRSSDGLSRTLIPADMMRLFFERWALSHVPRSNVVADLQTMCRQINQMDEAPASCAA